MAKNGNDNLWYSVISDIWRNFRYIWITSTAFGDANVMLAYMIRVRDFLIELVVQKVNLPEIYK
jgi:hypothetical protein